MQFVGRQEKMWTWTRSIESRCCPHIQQWLHCPPPPGSLTKVEMSENWWNLLTFSIWIKFYQENIVHIRLRICKWTETGWECQYFRHLKCSYCTQNCAGNLGWEMPPGLNSEKTTKNWMHLDHNARVSLPILPTQMQPCAQLAENLEKWISNKSESKGRPWDLIPAIVPDCVKHIFFTKWQGVAEIVTMSSVWPFPGSRGCHPWGWHGGYWICTLLSGDCTRAHIGTGASYWQHSHYVLVASFS